MSPTNVVIRILVRKVFRQLADVILGLEVRTLARENFKSTMTINQMQQGYRLEVNSYPVEETLQKDTKKNLVKYVVYRTWLYEILICVIRWIRHQHHIDTGHLMYQLTKDVGSRLTLHYNLSSMVLVDIEGRYIVVKISSEVHLVSSCGLKTGTFQSSSGCCMVV